MALAYFRMLNNELLKKDLYVVLKQATLIILGIKSAIFKANNGEDIKRTSQIVRRMNFVINGKECTLHKIVWFEGGLQMSDIGTNNVMGNVLNTRLEYTMVCLYN